MTSESSDKAAWSIIYLSLRAQPREKGVTVVELAGGWASGWAVDFGWLDR